MKITDRILRDVGERGEKGKPLPHLAGMDRAGAGTYQVEAPLLTTRQRSGRRPLKLQAAMWSTEARYSSLPAM